MRPTAIHCEDLHSAIIVRQTIGVACWRACCRRAWRSVPTLVSEWLRALRIELCARLVYASGHRLGGD